MRYLGLGLALVGAALGAVVGVLTFVIALVLAVAEPHLALVALAGLAGIITSVIAGLSAAGTLLPLQGRAAAMAVLVCASLQFLIYLGAGSWPVALPACIFLFPAGVLLLPAEE